MRTRISVNENVLAVVVAAALLGGCDYSPFGYTPIKDLVAAPASF